MESLTLEQTYYIGELVGVLVVIISLIYVGLQVKQNTNATHATAAQSFVEMYNTFTSVVGSSKETADIWRTLTNKNNYIGSDKRDRK